VLFADITGFTSLVETSGPDRAYEWVTGCLALLDQVVRRYGGSVDKHLGDCILGVFGVPKAIEDAPRAAVNAAIEMLGAVDRYSEERGLVPPLRIHVGINSGLAISGEVSGPLVREFAVMGDTVNVASRLKDQAPPGRVYVGASTWEQTRGVFQYRSLEPLALKGKSERVPAFELVSTSPQLHRGRTERTLSSPLVGRERELGRLGVSLQLAREGRGRTIAVVGDAGIGKSRLVEEFLRTPAASAATCLVGRARATGRTLAYHPFADLLRGFCRVQDEDSEASAHAALRAALEAHGVPTAERGEAVLASLMGLSPTAEQAELIRPIQDEAMENTIVATFSGLLARLAERAPVLVVLEDFHWADASSVGLTEALLPLTKRHGLLLLVLTRPRPCEPAERIERLAAEELAEHYEKLELEPLGSSETRHLLRELCGGGRVPPELLARIAGKASGNPFFVEEVLLDLLARGALQRDSLGVHARTDLPEVEIPDTVHEVILSRIDLLTREDKQALQLAAVLGRRFRVSVVEAMSDAPGAVHDSLLSLRALQMIEPVDPEQRAFEFVHPLIQEVAYDSILIPRREQIHRAAALAIESRLGSAYPGCNAMLAFHFGMARDLDRAELYLFRAGEEAIKLAAADEALLFFEEAARLFMQRHGAAGDPAKKAEIERYIARAHANRGDMVESIAHINRALELLGERVAQGALEMANEATRGVVALLRGLYLPRRRGRPATERDLKVIDLMFNRARAQTTADPARFVIDSFETFRHIQAVDPATVPGVGGMTAGMVGPLSYGGLSFKAARRVLAVAKPLVGSEPHERFLFAFMSFLHHFLAGDWDDRHEVDPKLAGAVLELGMLWDLTNYLFLLVEKKACQGRFEEAGSRLGEIHAIAETYRYDLAWSSWRMQSAIRWLAMGRLAEAREAADEHYAHHPEQLLSLVALGTRAETRARQGDLEGAEADVTTAEQILRRAGRVPPYQASYVRRARLLVDVEHLERSLCEGDPQRLRSARGSVRRSARVALGSARSVAARFPATQRLEGTRRWLSGDRRGAWQWWQRSLALAERLSAKVEWVHTSIEMGRLLSEQDPGEARRHLAAAASLCDELGLEADRLRVDGVGLDLGGGPG
jgi:class 3 adenylate cyclase/tetratricopeptide (TPR) repeat protein